ncbi:MAG: site-specific integrase [Verrucomicrobiota bacterium]
MPVIVRRPIPAGGGSLSLAADQWPSLIVRAGAAAQEWFLEFFAATIRNKNTRMAYFRAISRFLQWADERHLDLEDIRPIHTASYIKGFTVGLADPSVKQHLAAIRMLLGSSARKPKRTGRNTIRRVISVSRGTATE